MDNPDSRPPNRHSFSRYLLLCMILLVLCVVGFLTINDYLYTKAVFNNEEQLLQVQTEQNIDQAIRLKDVLWNTYDSSLNQQMQEGLDRVSAEYERSAHNPAQMNLANVKADLGENFDIYIIDESGVIVYTTYAPELGMDFKTIPDFYQYLTKIRKSEGFFPDRIVSERLGQGKSRKYAYMPTGDHKYILELGYAGKSFENLNNQVLLNDSIDRIVEVNPYITRYRVFNVLGRNTVDGSQPEAEVKEILVSVARAQSTLEITDPKDLIRTRYLFIDLKNDMYGSDPSRIVEITYSRSLIQDGLNRLLLYHLLTGAAAIVMGCIIAFFLSRRITRPIQDIVSDIELISRGDLDHRIHSTDNREFAILETSINTMVDSLKDAVQKMKDEEIFKKEMIDQLPVGVFIKRVDTGGYIFWNRTCEQLFHIPATTVIGKTDGEIHPAKVAARIEKEDLQVIRNPKEILRKVITFREPGGGIVHVALVPIVASTGKLQFILGICEDVSHENINLKMDLLFSITRHDILDNLSVIMKHLERAQLINSHDEMQNFYRKTLGSISSIKNQISSMRALQDLGLISPTWQPVGDAFGDAVRLLPEHKVAIRTDLNGVEIFADPLLPRVFYKLLEFTFRNSGPHLSSITMSARVSGDTLHILYQDDSKGLPDEDKEKVFDVGYDGGLFLIRELLGFTGISIREIGVSGKGCIFDIQVPKEKFRER
jgi:signal transduction histidine kinase